jgi:hypothetical protein
MRLANDQLSMQAHVTITPEEDDDAYVRSFLRSYAAGTLEFITLLIAGYNPNRLSSIIEILGQDKRFGHILSKTKERFDRKCNLVMENSN